MLIKVIDCERGKYATATGWSFDFGRAKNFTSLADAEDFCVRKGVKKAEAQVERKGLPTVRIRLAVAHTLHAAHQRQERSTSIPASTPPPSVPA